MRNRNILHTLGEYNGTIPSFIQHYPFYYAFLRFEDRWDDNEVLAIGRKYNHIDLKGMNISAKVIYKKEIRKWMRENGLEHFIQE